MPSSAAVGRVNAIDAAMLDGALLGLLASLARQALKHAPQAVRDGAAPALVPDGALLPALLFGATVLRGRPTPGMAMQNLRWEAADGSGALALRRRLALLAATVGARWAWGALGERLQAPVPTADAMAAAAAQPLMLGGGVGAPSSVLPGGGARGGYITPVGAPRAIKRRYCGVPAAARVAAATAQASSPRWRPRCLRQAQPAPS